MQDYWINASNTKMVALDDSEDRLNLFIGINTGDSTPYASRAIDWLQEHNIQESVSRLAISPDEEFIAFGTTDLKVALG